MKYPAKPWALAFLALALGSLSGCGGESGGLPSGLGAVLQGARLRTSILSLGVNSNTTIDGQLPVNVATGVSEGAGNVPTRKVRVLLKGAGVSRNDVPIELNFKNPETDFPVATPGSSIQDDVLDGGAETRCWVYPTPSSASGTRPILVKRDAPDHFALADPDTPDPANLLSQLNASASDRAALFATGVKTVLYRPTQGVPLRTGKYDVAIEFYTQTELTPPVGTPPTPFFVSYLKNAATVQRGKDVTLRSDDPSNPFDPAQRFARPVTGTIQVQGIPSSARTLRVRVGEIAEGQSHTLYEQTVTSDVGLGDASGQRSVPILFLNRLRKVAVQVEAFIGDGAGHATIASASPPIAVGRLFTSPGEGKNLTPDMFTVAFGTMKLSSRIKKMGGPPPTTPYFVTSLNGARTSTFNVVPGRTTIIDVSADLLTDADGIPDPDDSNDTLDPGPFEALTSKTIPIPSTSVYLQSSATSVPVSSNGAPVGNVGVAIDDAFQNLALSTNDATVAANSGTFDLTVKGLLPPDASGGNVRQPVTVAIKVPVDSGVVRASLTNVQVGTGLVRSVVVVANEEGGISLQKTVNTNADALDVDFNVINRALGYTFTVRAYSGQNGSGALLGAGENATSVDVGTSAAPGTRTVPLVAQTFTGGPSGTGSISGVAIGGVDLGTSASDATATLARGKTYRIDATLLLGTNPSATVDGSLFNVTNLTNLTVNPNGTISVPNSPNTTATGSFTLTYKLSGSPAISQTFFVKIKPSTGGVVGTVG